MDLSPVVVALILGIMGTLVSPIVLGYLTAREARRIRREDWARADQLAAELAARTDAVATQAAEAARLLAERQDAAAEKAAEAARLLLATNVLAAEQAIAQAAANEATAAQLGAIHVLVNATLSAAMASELVALEQQLELMRELRRPRERIDPVEVRVLELRAKLENRRQQTLIADAHTAAVDPTRRP